MDRRTEDKIYGRRNQFGKFLGAQTASSRRKRRIFYAQSQFTVCCHTLVGEGEPPDKTSASEGGGGHGKADVVNEVA